MDKSRSLPPLVRGRVTSVLIFFVDEINIFTKTLSLTEKLDLVLQVQWWGETLPAYIRPKQLQEDCKFNENSFSKTCYDHFIKYEIKTTLNLFLLYLRACEIIELCVVKRSKNYISGSAFLSNLSSLLNKNNELIKIPVFDYSGEEIGDVVIHFNFLEVFDKEPQQGSSKTSLSLKSSISKENIEREILANNKRLRPDYLTLVEKTIFYDTTVKKPVENFYTEVGSDEQQSEHVSNSEDTLFADNIPVLNKTLRNSLPQMKVLKDSSKVLDFCSTSKIVNSNTKNNNKLNSSFIKYKNKVTPTCKKKLSIKNSRDQNLSTSIQKISLNAEETEGINCDKQSDLQKLPSKDFSNKVLDYLLGSDMSKIDEESALKDFKKMSPSHTLVDSISQLCVNSNQSKTPSIKSLPSLNFDFSNPIERNYYEKFFLEPCSGDFEIAELLNQPKNILLTQKTDIIKEFSSNSSNSEKNANYFKTNFSVNKQKSGCARCKYYKKLDELDTIIESLKHFEQKMLVQEKNIPLGRAENSGDIKKKIEKMKDS